MPFMKTSTKMSIQLHTSIKRASLLKGWWFDRCPTVHSLHWSLRLLCVFFFFMYHWSIWHLSNEIRLYGGWGKPCLKLYIMKLSLNSEIFFWSKKRSAQRMQVLFYTRGHLTLKLSTATGKRYIIVISLGLSQGCTSLRQTCRFKLSPIVVQKAHWELDEQLERCLLQYTVLHLFELNLCLS